MPVAVHGTPQWGPWARPVAVKTWYGVKGALALVGANTTRDMSTDCTMTNYPLYELLEQDIQTMVIYTDNALSGTLNFDGILYPKCLFLGYEPGAPAFYDGSGEHGWTQFGRLRWLQMR